MKRFKPIVIDAKSLNRAADEVMKRRGTYFEPPLVRWHRLKREAREKVSNNKTNHMKKTIAFIALIITFTLFGILRSDGAQISYSITIPLTSTDYTNTVYLHQFPSSLGQLNKVVINSGCTNYRYAGFFSFATNSVNYNISYTNTAKVLWPDGTACLQDQHSESANGPLGISGGLYMASLTNVIFLNAESCKDFPPAKISPYSWLGNGVLPFKAVATGIITVTDMDFSQIFPFFLTQESFDLTVTYFYTPGLTGTAFPCH